MAVDETFAGSKHIMQLPEAVCITHMVCCVVGVRGDVDKVSQCLRLFSDTLEEWLECQKNWLYLENIFTAPDIQRQLPNETKLFAGVDRQFKSILRITRDRPAALQVAALSLAAMHSVYVLTVTACACNERQQRRQLKDAAHSICAWCRWCR